MNYLKRNPDYAVAFLMALCVALTPGYTWLDALVYFCVADAMSSMILAIVRKARRSGLTQDFWWKE